MGLVFQILSEQVADSTRLSEQEPEAWGGDAPGLVSGCQALPSDWQELLTIITRATHQNKPGKAGEPPMVAPGPGSPHWDLAGEAEAQEEAGCPLRPALGRGNSANSGQAQPQGRSRPGVL